MASLTFVNNDFSAGLTSPLIRGNPALREYRFGSEVFQNVIPHPGGRGFIRRPGSYYREGTPSNKRTRLFTVYPNANTPVVLEVNDTDIRYWNTSAYTRQTGDTPPWTENQLPYLRSTSIDGKAYIICQATTPRGGGQTALRTITKAGVIATPTFTGNKTFHSAAGLYPGIVGQAQGRLILGATANEPELVALSRAPDAEAGTYRYTDFTKGTSDDHAILRYANDEFNGGLQWVAGHKRVIVGGDATVFSGPPGLIQPFTWFMDDDTGTPSTGGLSVRIKGGVVFVAGPKPSAKLIVYSEEGGGLTTIDIGDSAEQILSVGVVAIAYTTTPWPIVWFGRADGMLVSCSIEVRQGQGAAWGWSEHPMGGDGLVEDITAVNKGKSELWMVVNRAGGTRTIETILMPQYIGEEDYSQQTEGKYVHFVDNGIRVVQAAGTTVSGLTHLEGYEVDAVADGASMARKTVSGGAVTYATAVAYIHVGLPFTCAVLPNRPEIAINGTWQAKNKTVQEVILRVHNTIGGKVGPPAADGSIDTTKLQALPYLIPGETVLGDPPTPFTGDIRVHGGFMGTDGQFYMIQDDPFPFTVLAAYSRIKVEET